MKIKTYTKRTNARRAALAVGVPQELIDITVHKSDQDVRFGWKQLASECGRQGPLKAAPGTQVLAPPEKRPQPPVTTWKREERNGVKRPRAGGRCAAVWEWLDAHPTASVGEAKSEAHRRGWNLNNTACEFYTWRHFNGMRHRA